MDGEYDMKLGFNLAPGPGSYSENASTVDS